MTLQEIAVLQDIKDILVYLGLASGPSPYGELIREKVNNLHDTIQQLHVDGGE